MLRVNAVLSRLLPLSIVLLLLSACGEQASEPSESVAEAMDDTQMEHAMKHRDPKYVCPMHPQIIRDEPGSCPICGMDLVKKQIQRLEDQGPEIAVSGSISQAINIRIGDASNRTLWKYIKTLGRVIYDETRVTHVHPRAAGWIEKLHVRAEGDPVKKGEPLLDLYSPEILDAQVDYLIALSGQGQNRHRSIKARNRLLLLDVPQDVIEQVATKGESQRRTPMRADENAIIAKLNVGEGMYVKPETEIMTLADLSRVWVQVDVYEHQLAWIKSGLSAEMRAPALPGRKWEGKVEYIYPEVDPKTRTLKVRLGFDNPDGALKPNLFADVVIYGGPKRKVLTVPREALIIDGDRTAVVKVVGEGKFRAVNVVPGMRTAKHVEILSGLKAGDRVVTSGQFLIDSEANIQASFARMSE